MDNATKGRMKESANEILLSTFFLLQEIMFACETATRMINQVIDAHHKPEKTEDTGQ